jgi:uncharacterized protein
VSFIVFLLIVLSIYTAMHCLVYWGIYPLLAGHPVGRIAVALWMALMIFTPVIIHLLEDRGIELPARILAWVGYFWLALIFLALWPFAAIGLYEIVNFLLSKIISAVPRFSLHGTVSAGIVMALTVAATIYGFSEASNIRVETVRITTDKLPPYTDRIRIAQVSDIHLGLMNREGTLAPIVLKLLHLEPDILVATGDVVDGEIGHLDGLSDLWNKVNPPLGKYAVMGNHEIYAGLDGAADFLNRSGFKILRNTGRVVGNQLTVVGVDDQHLGITDDRELDILTRHQSDRFTIYLKHRPTVADGAAERFDLQLSGHAHGGQIFPFNFITRLEYPMNRGLHVLPGGGRLYVSRGTGTWGPPIRIGAPPEITLFEITRTGASE